MVYRDSQYEERVKCGFCLAFVPCTMCCGIPYLFYLLMKGPSGPPDAARIPDHEAKAYLDALQGGCLVEYEITHYKKRRG